MNIVRSNFMGKYILPKLDRAKESIMVCSPYISAQYAQKLVILADRGAAVKVLTSNRATENDFSVTPFFKLAKQKGAVPNLSVIVLKHSGDGFEHSKLFIIDGKFAAVGSANLTDPGMKGNYETMTLTERVEDVAEIAGIFEKAWEESIVLSLDTSIM